MIDDMPFNWKMHYFPCVGIVRQSDGIRRYNRTSKLLCQVPCPEENYNIIDTGSQAITQANVVLITLLINVLIYGQRLIRESLSYYVTIRKYKELVLITVMLESGLRIYRCLYILNAMHCSIQSIVMIIIKVETTLKTVDYN